MVDKRKAPTIIATDSKNNTIMIVPNSFTIACCAAMTRNEGGRYYVMRITTARALTKTCRVTKSARKHENEIYSLLIILCKMNG